MMPKSNQWYALSLVLATTLSLFGGKALGGAQRQTTEISTEKVSYYGAPKESFVGAVPVERLREVAAPTGLTIDDAQLQAALVYRREKHSPLEIDMGWSDLDSGWYAPFAITMAYPYAQWMETPVVRLNTDIQTYPGCLRMTIMVDNLRSKPSSLTSAPWSEEAFLVGKQHWPDRKIHVRSFTRAIGDMIVSNVAGPQSRGEARTVFEQLKKPGKHIINVIITTDRLERAAPIRVRLAFECSKLPLRTGTGLIHGYFGLLKEFEYHQSAGVQVLIRGRNHPKFESAVHLEPVTIDWK